MDVRKPRQQVFGSNGVRVDVAYTKTPSICLIPAWTVSVCLSSETAQSRLASGHRTPLTLTALSNERSRKLCLQKTRPNTKACLVEGRSNAQSCLVKLPSIRK